MKRSGSVVIAIALTISVSASAPLVQAVPSPVSKSARCSGRLAASRTLAAGRFMSRSWSLAFYLDKQRRPCLTTDWHRYGSLYPFKVREGHPLVGILDIASTEAPGEGPGAYLMSGYISERVGRITFRLDGTTDDVRIVRSPAWTDLPKDLFIHFIRGSRFDRDRTARLRMFDGGGELLRTKVMHRRDFFHQAEAV